MQFYDFPAAHTCLYNTFSQRWVRKIAYSRRQAKPFIKNSSFSRALVGALSRKPANYSIEPKRVSTDSIELLLAVVNGS